MKADLHSHSTYSDGNLSIKEILKKTDKLGLEFLSITDHDSFEGSKEAFLLNRKTQIIIGLELSTFNNDESVHILGYFKNWERAKALDEFLTSQLVARRRRALQMIDNLDYMHGIKMNIDFLKELKSITRASIARELVKQKLVKSYALVFEKYLGDNLPAYIPSTHFSTEEGIKLIKKSKGLAVLAHPMKLKKNKTSEIISLGLDGIEAVYPNYENLEQYYRNLAKKHSLFITGGSDFHAEGDLKHGQLGQTYIEGEDLEIFLNRLYES